MENDWFEDIIDTLKGQKILWLAWDKEKVYVRLDFGVVYAKLGNLEAINKMREECHKTIDPDVFRKYQNK